MVTIYPGFCTPQHGSKSTVRMINCDATGSGSVYASSSTPGFYNFTGSNLGSYVIALAARAAGTRNATVACVGDSTTAGFYSTGVTEVAALNSSWPMQLAALMPNGSSSSRWGDNAYGASYNLIADSRMTFTGAWVGNGGPSVGAEMFYTGAAGRLTFTPTNQVNTFVVHYLIYSGAGKFNYSVDGGGSTLVDTNNGSTDFTSVTISPALGSHTLNIDWSVGDVFIIDIIAYNTAIKEVSYFNMGWVGSRTTHWLANSATYEPYARLNTLAPDLTIIDLTINDGILATGTSTYNTQLTSLVTNVQDTGSVILMSGNPVDSGFLAYGTQQAYVTEMHSVASALNVTMIDVFTKWGGTTALPIANGWLSADVVHPSASGYGVIAGYVQTALTPGFVSLP